MVSQWVPEALRRDVTEILNGFTANLGGQVIQRPILDEPAPGKGEGNGVSGQRSAKSKEDLASLTVDR